MCTWTVSLVDMSFFQAASHLFSQSLCSNPQPMNPDIFTDLGQKPQTPKSMLCALFEPVIPQSADKHVRARTKTTLISRGAGEGGDPLLQHLGRRSFIVHPFFHVLVGFRFVHAGKSLESDGPPAHHDITCIIVSVCRIIYQGCHTPTESHSRRLSMKACRQRQALAGCFGRTCLPHFLDHLTCFQPSFAPRLCCFLVVQGMVPGSKQRLRLGDFRGAKKGPSFRRRDELQMCGPPRYL